MNPTFTEDWYSQNKLVELSALAVRAKNAPGDFIEIGSWEGRSTIAIASAIGKRILYAVDTWAGSPGHESESLAISRDIFGTFKANTARYKNIHPIKMSWQKFVTIAPPRIAFLHIDGDHSYHDVRDCISEFIPRMMPGAIICGHDYWNHFPGVIRAVDELLPDAEKSEELWFKII